MSLSSRVVLQALFAAAAIGFLAPAHAAGDAARGKQLSYTCLGCHGIPDYKNVYPTYSVPELAGQHPEYILAALKEYRAGERSHATMHEQAASLSDQDMEDIAAYFGADPLKANAAPVGTAPAKVAICGSCHGKNGVGITGDYPTIAGQHADYIARALHEYQHGDRKNAIMPNFAKGLSDEEIAEIADYFSHQSPPLHTLKRRSTFLSSAD